MSRFVGEDTKDVALWWLFAQPGVDFVASPSLPECSHRHIKSMSWSSCHAQGEIWASSVRHARC